MPDGSAAPRVTTITPAAWDEAGWDRAWERGYAEGLSAGLRAAAAIAEADVLLQPLLPAERRAIWKEALYDVAQAHPGLPKVVRRAAAGRRIVLLVRKVVKR